ncbi:hypothetical protein Tco_0789329, partial [Tanacetum coccineum]
VIDMPEEMLVGQYLPPYYISQLGDCIIISGSFKFVDFSIIYAWELQVDDGEVSWHPEQHTLNFSRTASHDHNNDMEKHPLVGIVVVEDVGEDDDFKSGSWVSATNYVNAFGGTVTGCLGE